MADFNADHKHQFVMNHYMSTPIGKQIMNDLLVDHPDIKQHIMDNHVTPHTNIMKSQFADHPMSLALDSADTPIIPMNTAPKQPAPPIKKA